MSLLLTFYLTLKQYINEKRKAKQLLTNSPTQAPCSTTPSSSANTLTKHSPPNAMIAWLLSFLIKYWIFLSSITLLLMSCQQPVVAYRIGYMILFLYFIATFQVKGKIPHWLQFSNVILCFISALIWSNSWPTRFGEFPCTRFTWSWSFTRWSFSFSSTCFNSTKCPSMLNALYT